MDKCKICSNTLIKYLDGKDRWYNTSDKVYEIYRCENCRVEQLYPIPSKEEQLSFYPKNYYSYSLSQKSKLSIIMTYVRKISFFINHVLYMIYGSKYNVTRGGFDTFFEGHIVKDSYEILDIGCGDDITKKAFGNKRTWSGFEISDTTKNKDGIHYGPSISEINFGKQFDAIIALHVFEHVDNPHIFLKELHNLLNNGGHILLKLPSCEGIFNRLAGKYAAERDIPRHIFNYSKTGIERICHDSGFKIVNSRYLENYGSTIAIERYFKNNFPKSNIFTKICFMVFYFIGFICDQIVSILPLKTNQLGIILTKNNG